MFLYGILHLPNKNLIAYKTRLNGGIVFFFLHNILVNKQNCRIRKNIMYLNVILNFCLATKGACVLVRRLRWRIFFIKG